MHGQFKETVHDTDLDDRVDNDKCIIEELAHNPLLTQCKEINETNLAVKPVKNKLPVDTGWSWVILFGVTLEIMIVVGLFKASGIIFVAIQERFGSSASMTSIISTLTMASWSVASLLIMNIGSKFLSSRTITVIGTLATCASYVISSMARDIKLLLFSHGLMQGAGIGCMEPIALAMLGSYFEKHRGLACSIASSGGSLGGLVFAPLLTVMFQYYGFSGTLLLVAAFAFQCLVTAALFRPQEFYTRIKEKTKKRQTDSDIMSDAFLQKENTDIVVNGNNVSVSQQSGEIKTSTTYAQNSESNVTRSMNREATDLDVLVEARARAYSDSHTEIYSKTANIGTSSPDCITIHPKSIIDRSKNEDSGVSQIDHNMISGKNLSCIQMISELFDFSLFKNPVFIIILFAAGFLCVPCALSMIYLAPHAKDLEIEPHDIAKLLTVYSAIDMCSRLVVGFTSDRKWIRRSTMITISACVVCTISQCMTLFTTFSLLLAYSAILGIFAGNFFAIFIAVILDYLPIAKLHSIIGFIFLMEAVFVSSGYAIVGTLRDTTGSYNVAFHFLGSMALVAGVLFASLPLVERYHKSKETTFL